MNELLELIKAFNEDKSIYVIANYIILSDAYEIEMREYDYEHNTAIHVKRIIQVNDLLSAKIPTHEVIVKVLNEMH